MGIISRFADIMKSNINALLDKAEDPSKMVDQMLRDLREELADVKKETTGIMANAENAKRKVTECESKIERYSNAAMNALSAGNEADAKTLIAEKQKLEAQLPGLRSMSEVAAANADKMRAMHNKLVQDIESLESRKDAIKAKEATAKAQDKVNKITAGGRNVSASMEAFDRMEARADKRLDAAMAEAELNADNTSASHLAEKYSGSSTSVDDELAAMKQKLGI